MNIDKTAAEVANQIRGLCEEIDNKVERLRSLGFNNARVSRNDATRKLEFTASRTTEHKL